MNLSSYVLKVDLDHTISGQGTGISALDHSTTTQQARLMGMGVMNLIRA